MTVDKIGKLNEVAPVAPAAKTAQAAPTAKASDSVRISDSALKQAELQKSIEMVKSEPDPEIRTERVAAAKARLAEYMQNSASQGKVLDKVAQEIAYLLTH